MGGIIMLGGTLLLMIIGKAVSFIDEMEAKRKKDTGEVLSAEIENMDDSDKMETENSGGLKEIIKAIVGLAILLCLPWIIFVVQLLLCDEEFVLR